MKATNEQTRKTRKNSQTQKIVWWFPEGKGWIEVEKGFKNMVTEGDLTLGGEYVV